MSDLIVLPTVQIVMRSAPDVVDACCEFAINRFGTLPAAGDMLNGLSDLGTFGAVKVISRHFFRDDNRTLSWWMLLVEEVKEEQAIVDIDRDVREAYIEIRAEEQASILESLSEKAKAVTRPRRRGKRR